MSKFKKGDPKPANSGRKRGTKNIKTLVKAEELLSSTGTHPLSEILKLIPSLSPDLAVKAWIDIYKFVEGQKKGDQHPTQTAPSAKPDSKVDIPTDRLLEIINEKPT